MTFGMVVLVVLATSVPTAQAEVCNEKPCITVTPCLTAGFSNQLNLLSQSKEKIEYKKKYVKGTYVNIREQPSKNSEVIKQVSFNEQVIIIENELTNGCWYTVDLDDKTGYIHKDYVSDKPINYRIYNVPYAKNKTWMPYTAITSRGSKQYKLQQKAYTSDYGIRMVNGRYCVAIGSHFECKIGQYFDLILANGEVIPCIMADAKSNKHTDSANIITISTNCLSEFIVDKNALNRNAKRDGDISSCCPEWESTVKQVKVYGKVI
jgi:hypothetical protein